MKIFYGIPANCSEAVFRFYTVDVKEIKTILKAFIESCCTEEGYTMPEIEKPEDVDGIVFPAVNEDGECIFEPELNAFVLRVRNNDVSETTIDAVKRLGIFVEEAENSPRLREEYARDCTCGERFFDGYPKLLKRTKGLE
ncbi:MAG: hypothetical protein QXH91_04160 [Candidatus Bathyarchaeia archaeon]